MVDLSTMYAGVKLKNPIIAGASGLTARLETIKMLEQAGAAAIVCKSLFEEQIELEALKLDADLHKDENLYAEMLTHFPEIKHAGVDEHLFWVRKTKQEIDIPCSPV